MRFFNRILCEFVRRCGTQTIIEDRQISRAILDVTQKLTDAVNTIVGWQLESTTWLKRTLVVRQDAAGVTSKSTIDSSPTMDLRSSIMNVAQSENNSMRGSTISLAMPSNRLSSIDGMSQFNGSLAQLSMNSDNKKSSSNLRSSVKDTNNNKKNPTDSTNALFLLAEVSCLFFNSYLIFFRISLNWWMQSQKVKTRKNSCQLFKQFGEIHCLIWKRKMRKTYDFS